jgi:cytochrome c6
MREVFMIASLMLSVCILPASLLAKDTPAEQTGESLFNRHCVSCHPNGGNILNPKKTLYIKDLQTNNIVTAEDIVKKIRNPGPVPTHPQEWAGMTMFDEKKISNENALKIADYILKTFK